MKLSKSVPALLAAILLTLVALPALADEAPTGVDGIQPASAETVVTETVVTETAPLATVADTEPAPMDMDVLTLLGFDSPLYSSQSPAGLGFYPGYCYHDCSPCETRDDCKPPGARYGFPCTEIPLC